jgi:hypothetical protein
MVDFDDSFWATGENGEWIGFYAGRKTGFSAGAPIGAYLRGTEAGCKGLIGREDLLDNQPKGYGVGGSSDAGHGVIGVSSPLQALTPVSDPSGILGIHTGDGNGVKGTSVKGTGVVGITNTGLSDDADPVPGVGVYGHNTGEGIAIRGESDGGDGILGSGVTIGVQGVASSAPKGGRGAGVVGIGTAESPDARGVHGWSEQGRGVVGESVVAVGVSGNSGRHDGIQGSTSAKGRSGVWGSNIGGGFGVTGSSVGGPGVDGRCSGDNVGVAGHSTSTRHSGVWGENTGGGGGVSGSSASGYGGIFQGGRAPICLTPSSTQGPPQTRFHDMGELFVDSDGVLYFCIGQDPHSPFPIWKKVQLI